MNLRSIVRSQKIEKLDQIRRLLSSQTRPKSGWITTVREALGMTAEQVARRANTTRAYVSNSERAERADEITFRRMQRMAEAMNCDFVYFLVPRGDISKTIEAQAEKHARALLRKAGVHMSLEGQQLDNAQQEQEVRRLTQELIANPPQNFWSDPS